MLPWLSLFDQVRVSRLDNFRHLNIGDDYPETLESTMHIVLTNVQISTWL